MTEQQKVFADYYLMNGNSATQAAKDAGCSERMAYSQGQRLLKNVEIMNTYRRSRNGRQRPAQQTRTQYGRSGRRQ